MRSDVAEDFTECIESLKRYVKPYQRRYCPERREWDIKPPAEREFQRWLSYCRANLDAEIEWLREDEQAHQPPPRKAPPVIAEQFAALCLLPSAPVELVRAAYKILSRIHHPDRGGNHQQMCAINEAYERLEKQLEARVA